DWRAGLNGKLEILRGFNGFLSARYRDGHEARGANDPALDPLRAPIQVEETNFSASLAKEFGRFRVTGAAASDNFDFHDGTRASGANFDQDFRDETLLTLSARVDLALSPSTALFASYANHDHQFDLGARDFTSRQALIGAGFDITHLVRGEIGVGYFWTDFDNPAQSNLSGGSLNARIDWFVTRLTTVNFHASRDIADSGIITSSSIENETAGVRVDHELRRNIILSASADYQKQDYQGIDRQDEYSTFSLGADWLVNRWATLGAHVTQEDRSSAGAARDRDYDRTRASISLTLKR
ncbi:MAG: outer membrane beta-barrel protein, partial [Hyphomonadaceae bacterium]